MLVWSVARGWGGGCLVSGGLFFGSEGHLGLVGVEGGEKRGHTITCKVEHQRGGAEGVHGFLVVEQKALLIERYLKQKEVR